MSEMLIKNFLIRKYALQKWWGMLNSLAKKFSLIKINSIF